MTKTIQEVNSLSAAESRGKKVSHRSVTTPVRSTEHRAVSIQL